MPPSPTASQKTVREVLAEFDGSFAVVAQAIEDGEFALWVGSGISRQAPNLGNLIEKAFDYIRARAIVAATATAYMPAFQEALTLAEVIPASVESRFSQPVAQWPEHDAIINKLWNKYSRVLDLRITGESADFVLWDAINIRQAFDNPAPPSTEHLCIAILVLEGVIRDIASANWDGFIERAVERLSGGVAGIMQVVVDPNQLRGPAGRARLLKFHGCIVYAKSEPLVFRQYLTGSYTQIMGWPEAPKFAAMCNAVVGLATNQKTMVLGLSIQDNNLQTLFTRAKQVHAWPWPCAPNAPAHIFCEDQIQQGQRDVLRLVYGDAYNHNPAALHEGTLLRAWGEQVLIALVLKLLTDKLVRLMELGLTAHGKAPLAGPLAASLNRFRDAVAELAVIDPVSKSRTPSVDAAISLWSRMLCLFRTGALPANADGYETLTSSTLNLLNADQNALAMGLGHLGLALSLLNDGRDAGHWTLSKPVSNNLTSGVMTARSTRADGVDRPVFVVKSTTEAIALQRSGAFANDNAIVIHAGDAWGFADGTKTARRVRAAPGRTGYVGETHIGLSALLADSDNTPALQQRFASEMIL